VCVCVCVWGWVFALVFMCTHAYVYRMATGRKSGGRKWGDRLGALTPTSDCTRFCILSVSVCVEMWDKRGRARREGGGEGADWCQGKSKETNHCVHSSCACVLRMRACVRACVRAQKHTLGKYATHARTGTHAHTRTHTPCTCKYDKCIYTYMYTRVYRCLHTYLYAARIHVHELD